jgi:hypothetical protein
MPSRRIWERQIMPLASDFLNDVSFEQWWEGTL